MTTLQERHHIAKHFDDLLCEEAREFIARYHRHKTRGSPDKYIRGRFSDHY